MEIEIDGLKVSLDTKRAMVRIELPGGGHIERQGIQEVLLFGILATLYPKAAQHGGKAK